MLALFRRALGSWIVLALLAVVVLAFVVTGVGSPVGLGGGAPTGDSVASIDGRQVPTAQVEQRIRAQYQDARQQQPDLTLPAFLGLAGGLDALVDRYVSARVLEVWGVRSGLVASDKLVDAQIAEVPAFRGLDGKFDEKQMQGLLAQQRLTLNGLRDGIRGDIVRRELIVPMAAAALPTPGAVAPYAGLLVAARHGEVGLVPYRAEAVARPSDADVAAWYRGHLAGYSVPERRVIRYAAVDLAAMRVPTPDDAAVAARYKADAAKYAASQKRTLRQVVLPDEASARAFAAKLAAGTSFADAATAAGFDAAGTSLGTLAQADFAAASSAAIAAAAFAAPTGSTTAPLRSALGWHVVHVDGVQTTPARSLTEARGEILGELLKQARTDALNRTIQKIDDALGDGAGFDDVVKANGLTVVTTPAITAAGQAPADASYKPDPVVAALLKPSFLAAPEDAPTLETVGADGQSALLSVASVQPAAALPLAQVADRARADLVTSRAADVARRTALAIKAKVDAGQPLASALAAAGLPAPQPLGLSQFDLRQAREVPPAVRALFALAPGRSALAAGPGGVAIVRLDRIDPPAQALVPTLTAQLRGELGRTMGDEYIEEFVNAAKRDVTVRRNQAAIQALGRQLAGRAPAGQ